MSGVAVATMIEVELGRGHAGVLERLASRREREVARRLVAVGDAPLLDPGAGRDPFVRRLDHALEVGVRQHPLGRVGAEARDADRDAVAGDVGDHALTSRSARRR